MVALRCGHSVFPDSSIPIRPLGSDRDKLYCEICETYEFTVEKRLKRGAKPRRTDLWQAKNEPPLDGTVFPLGPVDNTNSKQGGEVVIWQGTVCLVTVIDNKNESTLDFDE